MKVRIVMVDRTAFPKIHFGHHVPAQLISFSILKKNQNQKYNGAAIKTHQPKSQNLVTEYGIHKSHFFTY